MYKLLVWLRTVCLVASISPLYFLASWLDRALEQESQTVQLIVAFVLLPIAAGGMCAVGYIGWMIVARAFASRAQVERVMLSTIVGGSVDNGAERWLLDKLYGTAP